jgi:PAS domain S-box-containing protein
MAMIVNGKIDIESSNQSECRLKALEDKVADLEQFQISLVRENAELEGQVKARTASIQALNQELALELARCKIALEASGKVSEGEANSTLEIACNKTQTEATFMTPLSSPIAEIPLQDSQRFINRIADASSNILYVYDIQERRNIYVNHGIYQILGYPPAEIQAMGDDFFTNLMHPEDLSQVPAEYARIAVGRDDEVFEFEYRMKHFNGQWLFLHSRHVVFNRDANGKVKQTIGTAEDISDRKRLEQEKSQLIALLESSIVGSAQDTTDRQRLEQENSRQAAKLESINTELIRATRLKSEFIAIMSHELRTPLNPIIAMSQALQHDSTAPLNDEQKGLLSTIESSGRKLLGLIERLMEASINATGNPLNLVNVEITELCHDSLASAQKLARRKQIVLTSNIPTDLGEIAIDKGAMHRVLKELLDNAIKFNRPGGGASLDVYWEEVDAVRTLCFSIQDTGIGIAAENFEKLFQPFVQLDSDLNRRYDGMGLGLTLVRQNVEQHGGSIEFSTELGQGSCFLVRIPSTC